MTNPPSPGSVPASSPPRSNRNLGIAVGAILVVLLLVLASVYFLKIGPFAPSGSNAPTPREAAGFTEGQVVTFVYPGNFTCLPALPKLFPNASSVNSTTSCVVGAADQNALDQVPEWVLVPVFAGLSIFGLPALGSDSRGFPQSGGHSLLTDCGAGGSPTGCPDHPTYLYSPAFTAVEQFINITAGYQGLPEGVLPTPAHDHLINTSATYPNVWWGTVVVLVLDPNIFPDRATGTCTVVDASNLPNPTGNCLSSLAGLGRAMGTNSTAVAAANGGSANNPIWKALGGPNLQVVVPGDLSILQENDLNSNLYIPFSVQPGTPTLPT